MKEESASQMKLIGGRLCLDFTNTVGGRAPSDSGWAVLNDKLKEYRDFVSWSHHTNSISEGAARKLIHAGEKKSSQADAILKRAIRLREGLYRIFSAAIEKKSAPIPDLELLNRELHLAREKELLVTDAGHFSWKWNISGDEMDQLIWPIALSAADLLTEADLTKVRRCPGENCSWFFEDTSKNRSRQWCDMGDCGNLAKVRRFRARSRN